VLPVLVLLYLAFLVGIGTALLWGRIIRRLRDHDMHGEG
jgi:phosphate/sulfate permease